jgi:hypothetical protein
MFNPDFLNTINASIEDILNLPPPDLNFLDADLSFIDEDAEISNLLFGGILYSGEPEITEITNKKWNVNQKRITFTLNNNEVSSFFEANESLDALFKQIFEKYVQNIDGSNFIEYVINHDKFDRPISSCYMKRAQMESDMLQRSFEDVF